MQTCADGITPYNTSAWGLSVWEGALQKGPGILLDNKLNRSQKSALEAKKANIILACMRMQPAGIGKWFFPLPWWDTSGVLCSVLDSPVPVRHEHAVKSPVEATKLVRWLEHRTYKKKLSKSCLSRLEKRKQRGNPVAVYHYLIRGYQEDRVILFLELHRHRKRGYGHELEHAKSQLIFLFFKYQNSLLWEASPSLELFKIQLDKLRGLGLGDLQMCLPT